MKYPKVRSLRDSAALCITLISVLFLATAACGQPVPLFSATYKVSYGILRGEMTLELRQAEETAYIYETSLTPRGIVSVFRRGSIVETTSLKIEDGELRPIDYRSTDTIANPTRNTEYLFGTPPDRVTGVYKERAVDEPLLPNGHNRISAHVAVMLAMNTGASMTGISVFDRARWRDFEFEVFPGQVVKTKLGEYETVEIRYSSQKKNKSWSLHCAEALDYAPVMIVYREDDDIKSKAQLVEYRPLGDPDPDQPQPISSR
ncbi:MAG: DUF3108 domain-containing protein [Gammaproteobacteria bacterium]|nr:DUF3108 domain-containing protein [Gammaproteobacteria bacterium]